jgi:hypothetical protein
MISTNKNRVFFFFTLAAIGILLLASGVSGIIRPPETFFRATEETGSSLGSSRLPISINVVWVITIFLALYIVALLAILITPEGRRRFLVFVVIIAAIILALNLMPPREPETVESTLPEQDPVPGILIEEPFEPTPIAALLDQPPASVEWLVTLVGVILAAGLVALVVMIIVVINRRRRMMSIEEGIAQHAQKALDEFDAGYDYHDVIIRCYAQMSRVLLEEKGVEREIGMTPHEFENALVRNHFPAEPVIELTRLFEEVRYGAINQTEGRVEIAKSSLGAIITYCRDLPVTPEGML